ncbi:UPF0481 protein [Rosa sericea]
MVEPTVQSEQRENAPVLFLQEWCIYRVPSQLRNVDEAAYTPQTLSIGPFHHGNPKLRDMEAHKNKYYELFCRRSSKSEDELGSFMTDHRETILNCYAGTFKCEIDFLNLILVDACFIIELFLSNSEQEQHNANYYILRSPWLRKTVERDLILLENQLPYFLLQKLYDFAIPTFSNGHLGNGDQTQGHAHKDSTNSQQCCFPCFRPGDFQENSIRSEPNQHGFLELTCKFFKAYTKGKSVRNGFEPKHFTDLVRHFLCPYKELLWVKNYDQPVKIKYHAKKLKVAGVKFMPLREPFVIKEDPVLTFNSACLAHKELKLTRLWAEYEAECIFRNTMALEQLMYSEKPYICCYFSLMNQLINTEEDVDVLIEDGVIFNLLGSNKAVVNMISSLCEQIKEDHSCYSEICQDINSHYKTVLYHPLVIIRQVYFKDLWRGSTAILGFVVLVFTILQSLQAFELL